MVVIVVTPPEPIVSLDDAKIHLRIDHGDDDLYIKSLIAGATEWLDGPRGWLGRALGLQTLELITDEFYGLDEQRGVIPLPFMPVVDIVSVSYVNPQGFVTAIDPALYEPTLGGVRPIWGTTWPAVRCQSDAVRVRYRAGFGSFDGSQPPVWKSAIPKPIWVAVLMLVAQFYENRTPIAVGATVQELPFAVDALLSSFRLYR